jgi:NADH oxidoreductase Hcr
LVQVVGRGQALEAELGANLLDVLERAGLRPAMKCRRGVCGRCKIKVVRGDLVTRSHGGLLPKAMREGWILPCSTRLVGDIEIDMCTSSDIDADTVTSAQEVAK